MCIRDRIYDLPDHSKVILTLTIKVYERGYRIYGSKTPPTKSLLHHDITTTRAANMLFTYNRLNVVSTSVLFILFSINNCHLTLSSVLLNLSRR